MKRVGATATPAKKEVVLPKTVQPVAAEPQVMETVVTFEEPIEILVPAPGGAVEFVEIFEVVPTE
jgi:hypothetical protein